MRHRWLVGASSRVRRAVTFAGVNAATDLYVVDSDARRGPFAGTCELVRRIAPALCIQDPAAVRAHGIELFTLAPELWAPVGLPTEDLTSAGAAAGSTDHKQRYSRLETLRIAHGLVDLLHAWGATVGHSTVVYDNVDRADSTEVEMLAVAVRWLPAELVELVVCSTPDGVAEPLAGTLRRHALWVDTAASTGGGLSLTSR